MGEANCGSGSTFTPGCSHVRPVANTLCTLETKSSHTFFSFESYGPHSRCIMAANNGGSAKAACLRTRCGDSSVEIQIGDEVHTCQGEGMETANTSVFTGQIECPSFEEMCKKVMPKRCPMDCYGQGFCMADNTCQCLGGFSGADCNQGLPKE